MKRFALFAIFVVVAFAAIGCATAPTPVPPTAAPTQAPAVAPTAKPAAAPTATSIRSSITSAGCNLILSTTTSTQDSGLLDFILPDFQKKFNCKVDVVAVGTGQAIAIGQKGDADVLLVHARAQEDKFVADGHAKERFDVMYNDFILVGPKSDPAKISGVKSSKDAFKAIATAQATFASRGDQSGTNTKELSIWSSIGITPTKSMAWYNALGQGMGETLLFSEQQNAYTLSDRATWLATKDKLPDLIVLVGGNNIKENADKDLLNPYGVMAVNPDKHPGVNYDMAMNFVKWITGVDEQKVIASYGVDKYGQQLFYPSSKEYLGSLTSAGNVVLTITGAVANPQTLSLDALKAMPAVKITAQHPKLGPQNYEGIRLNTLLDQVQLKPEATKLTLSASDGSTADVTLADVHNCADCLVAFNTDGSLSAAMPGMPASAWVQNLIKIEAK